MVFRANGIGIALGLLMGLGTACGSSSGPSSLAPGKDAAPIEDSAMGENSDAGSPGADSYAGGYDTDTADARTESGLPETDAGALETGSGDGSDGAAASNGDVVGKITVGYQGWFAAVGEGSPVNRWWHYDNNTLSPPSPSDNFLKGWPDETAFTSTFNSGFANLGNGGPATLFSS